MTDSFDQFEELQHTRKGFGEFVHAVDEIGAALGRVHGLSLDAVVEDLRGEEPRKVSDRAIEMLLSGYERGKASSREEQ